MQIVAPLTGNLEKLQNMPEIEETLALAAACEDVPTMELATVLTGMIDAKIKRYERYNANPLHVFTLKTANCLTRAALAQFVGYHVPGTHAGILSLPTHHFNFWVSPAHRQAIMIENSHHGYTTPRLLDWNKLEGQNINLFAGRFLREQPVPNERQEVEYYYDFGERLLADGQHPPRDTGVLRTGQAALSFIDRLCTLEPNVLV